MVNGVVNPIVKPFPVGANSARTAGIAINESNVNKQTSLLNTAHGGKKRKIKGAHQILLLPFLQCTFCIRKQVQEGKL